jgi:hypothetical protein
MGPLFRSGWLFVPALVVVQACSSSHDAAGPAGNDASADGAEPNTDASTDGATQAPVTDADIVEASVDADAERICPNPGGSCDGPPGSAVWASANSGTGSMGESFVAVDGAGNIYLAGYFSGTINFAGTGDGGLGSLTSAGASDIFIAKFSPAGVPQWSKRFGDASTQYIWALAVDVAGNLFVTGEFGGTLELAGSDGGAGTLVAANADYYSGFVAKFDTSGDYQWGLAFGNGLASTVGSGIAVDNLGGVAITGNFRSGVSFSRAGDGGTDTLTSAGSDDVLVAKFGVDGTYLWSRQFGDHEPQDGQAIAADAAGNLYVTGYYFGTVTFPDADGGSTSWVAPSAANSESVFLVKLDPDGDSLWSKGYGAQSVQGTQTVAVTPAGDVYAAHSGDGNVDFAGPADAGPNVLVGQGLDDIFVAKFDTNGNYAWGHQYGDAANQTISALAVDGAGGVVLTGNFQGSVNFAGSADAGAATLTSASGSELFVAKLTSGGASVWSQAYATGSPLRLAVDSCSDDLLLAGDYTSGSLTFPAASDAASFVLPPPAVGPNAGFLARLVP